MRLPLQQLLVRFGGVMLALTTAGAATTNDAPLTLDPALTRGFAALKQTAGFVAQPADQLQNDWQPNLQLWVGVKAVDGKKQTLHYVQLTTLPPPASTNGHPWQPELRTNQWSWPNSTNKNAALHHAQYLSALYPVRVRVFDAAGRALKEGQTPMAWGMVTNGLLDMCRLSLELIPHDPANPEPVPFSKLSETDTDRILRAMGGGFLWMVHMFGDFQTVPSVADVWKQAQCAIRMPGAWTLAKGLFTGFTINLSPRLQEVTRTTTAATTTNDAPPLYRLPLDLRSADDQLARVEIILGPARGAEMLLAGIRSIRAVHPDKPQREFLAQVLATGTVSENP